MKIRNILSKAEFDEKVDSGKIKPLSHEEKNGLIYYSCEYTSNDSTTMEVVAVYI